MHRLRHFTIVRTLRLVGCLAACNFWSLPAVAQEVTLPLSRYEEMLARARVEPAPASTPPSSIAFEEAKLTIRVDTGEGHAKIVQDLTLTLLAEGWHSLTLGDAGRFLDADFGDAQGRLDIGKGGSTLSVQGVGRHRLRVTSARPVILDEDATRPTWRLRISAPPVAMVRGSLETPGGVDEVEAEGAIVSRAEVDGHWTFVAKPGAEVRLALYGVATLPRRETLPLAFEAKTAVALEVSRGRRRARGWLDARVRQGRLERLRVPIPAGFEVVDVGGDAVAGWDTDGGGLVVTPLAPVAERLRLKLELAADAADEVAGPVLVPDDAATVLAATKVHVRGDGLLLLVDAGAARQPDSRQLGELPSAFRSAPGLALVRTGTSPGTPSRWQVKWAEGAEVLGAQVDRLRVDVVAGDAGRSGYQLWAEVRNRGVEHLAVELPAAAELIAAARDGRRVEPGRSGAAWTVPLAVGDERQVIHLSSVVPLALPDAGRFDLPLPALSAPAGRVEVSIWLPGGRVYQLIDDDRCGHVGAPPEPRREERRERPAAVAGWRLGAAPTSVAQELFSRPPGFQRIQAAWSALTASMPPLAIRIKDDDDRRRWF